MVNFIEDSYCGLFCGACEILLAFRRSLENDIETEWKDLPEQFTSMIPEYRIECCGCKTDNVFEGCRKCRIRVCASGKGVEFCFECIDYPCEQIEALRSAIGKIREKLPHTAAIIGNLAEIERKGKTAWIDDQRKHWSCRKCGSGMSWYQTVCHKCSNVNDPRLR